MRDWAGSLVDAERMVKKCSDNLIASQSVGDVARQVAWIKAEQDALQAMGALGQVISWIREQRREP